MLRASAADGAGQPDAAAPEQVLALVADGTVTVEIARAFRLDAVVDAHRFARNDYPRGKVILIA